MTSNIQVVDTNGYVLTGHAATAYLEENGWSHKHVTSDAKEDLDETPIPTALYNQLDYLGLIPSEERGHNVGESDYSKQLVQPWTIWLSYPDLTSWDHDIIKRTLRTKSTDSRQLDYEKIIHICQERIRQLSFEVPDVNS